MVYALYCGYGSLESTYFMRVVSSLFLILQVLDPSMVRQLPQVVDINGTYFVLACQVYGHYVRSPDTS